MLHRLQESISYQPKLELLDQVARVRKLHLPIALAMRSMLVILTIQQQALHQLQLQIEQLFCR